MFHFPHYLLKRSFVCVGVLWSSQPIRIMSSAVSSPNHTFSWASLVLSQLSTTCAHTYVRNWQLPLLNQRKGENDRRKYFMINLISTKECCRTRRGSNPRPPDHQSDAHPTEPSRPVYWNVMDYKAIEKRDMQICFSYFSMKTYAVAGKAG